MSCFERFRIDTVNPMNRILASTAGCVLMIGQSMNPQTAPPSHAAPQSGQTFQQIVQSVNSTHPLIVLTDPQKRAMIAVSPTLQGRVLTSTADGWSGHGFGWVNLSLFESGKVQEHFNAYGGEDRIWIGPEGGQFSVFFAPGAPFDLAHWYTPAPLDTEPFHTIEKSTSHVKFESRFTLQNYSGTHFKVKLQREVRLLDSNAVWQDLHLSSQPGLKVVGFESINTLTNAGTGPWDKQTGLLSLWVLGQFEASPDTTIVIPAKKGPVAQLGESVNTDYFGDIPGNRIRVLDDVIFFKADARFRSKIGFSPSRASGTLASFDAHHHVLTIVQYPAPKSGESYVNSAWKLQDQPYNGDVANSYNDGPQSPGGPQLGNFYELESSSPAAALAPGQSIEHTQSTIHIQGDREQLDRVARAVCGVGLDAIENALPE